MRPAGGDRAVDAARRSVLAGPARRLGGNDRAIVVPLRPGLVRGAYTVRWRVVSNDGHLIQGVLAFAVGTGSPRPVPTLSAGGGLSASAVALRLLFLAGVLLAGGAALAGRVLRVSTRLQAAVMGGGLALVAGGGFGLLALEPAADSTRFGRVTETAAIAALVGVAAALASFRQRRAGLSASAAALLVLATPTLSGHALDPHRLRALVALADFVHVAGAAFWVGGLLLVVLSRSRQPLRRFPPLALLAVTLLGVGAIPRAIAALSSVGDLVHTGYGRALVVKTGLLAAVLAVAWLNRKQLRHLGPVAELALLAGVIAAVAVLTDLPPPARSSPPTAAVSTSRRPAPPPSDAVVLAGQDDDVAIGLAASPRGRRIEARVTALGPDGLGVARLSVTIAGTKAAPCGAGCYAATVPLPATPRRIPVEVGDKRLVFTLPAGWPAPRAAELVARTARVYRGLRTLVIHERLASSAKNGISTTYEIQAPNRLAYKIAGGPQAVIIGGTRWDRLPGGAWQRSELEPLTEPEPFWGTDPVRNARLLGVGRVAGRPVSIASFYDPQLPAWFEVYVDRKTSRLLALRMTAQAHFMRHRYSGFDESLRIVPPARSTHP